MDFQNEKEDGHDGRIGTVPQNGPAADLIEPRVGRIKAMPRLAKNFLRNFRRLFFAQDRTHADAAGAIGLSAGYFSKLLNAFHCPSLEVIEKIAVYFGKDAERMLRERM